MVRYLLLRTLVFFGCLCVVWLAGLRAREEQLLLVVIAALLSLAVSAVVLRPFRRQASADIAARVERRRARKEQQAAGRISDEQAEDAELTLGGRGHSEADYR